MEMKTKGFLSMKDFLRNYSIFEGGNAVTARPLQQSETVAVYDFVQKKIFPLIGLEGEGKDAAVIGSFGKKLDGATSGDIDIAVSADVIATKNGIGFNEILDFINNTLKSKGYETLVARGFNQVSVSVQIPGTHDYGQVDLMLSTNLDWSRFMYHSPNFREAESKYKGAYRNILLMSIISESQKKVEKTNDKGDTVEYSQYAVRLESGVYQVQKSYQGKGENLVKTAKLLHDYDKFITNTPEGVVKLAFGDKVVPADVMTFESTWSLFMSNDFIHREIREKIANKLYHALSGKFPLPTEAVEAFPNIFK